MAYGSPSSTVSAARGTTASRPERVSKADVSPTALNGLLEAVEAQGRREGALSEIKKLMGLPSEVLAAACAAIQYGNTPAEGELAASRILSAHYDHAETGLRLKRDELTAKIGSANREMRLLSALEGWVKAEVVLEAVQDSVLHKALSSSNWFPWAEVSGAPRTGGPYEFRSDYTVFLVQHDWAALTANATTDAGAVRLPFEHCCFEMAFSGRRICALIDCRDGEAAEMITLVWTHLGWLYPDLWEVRDGALHGRERLDGWDASWEVAHQAWAQIRAIAITLDAEVAQSVPVRAPYRLNAARVKRGALPIFEHRVLTLAHKTRAAGLSSSEPNGRHPRAHFRRGHWRHYPAHKTWIKWMLVGDLRLGFIDKAYRLSATTPTEGHGTNTSDSGGKNHDS